MTVLFLSTFWQQASILPVLVPDLKARNQGSMDPMTLARAEVDWRVWTFYAVSKARLCSSIFTFLQNSANLAGSSMSLCLCAVAPLARQHTGVQVLRDLGRNDPNWPDV